MVLKVRLALRSMSGLCSSSNLPSKPASGGADGQGMQDLTYPMSHSAAAAGRPSDRSASRLKMESPARLPRHVRTRKARRVLIVEDDDEQRSALKEQLSMVGYKVTVALDDASMAWSLQFCQFDAVIVDLDTPDSLLLEVLAEVHECDPLRSLMIISGGNEHQQRVARSIGAHVVEGTSESVDALGRLLLG